jgi:hypothetical protein
LCSSEVKFCDADGHGSSSAGTTRLRAARRPLVASQRAIVDGAGIHHRVGLGDYPTRHFRCRRARHGTGLTRNRAVVLSPFLARRGRELGLAFASAQLVHVGLVLWLYYMVVGPGGAMDFFWLGILCTYLLALFSLPWLHSLLGPRLWRLFRTITLEYIALTFAADFILGPLHARGFDKFPPTYLPFVLMLVGGAGPRIAAFSNQKLLHLRENLSLGVYGLPRVFQFGGTSRADRLVVWPLLIFVGALLVLLILDDALWGFMAAALALYGVPIVVFVAYVLFKLAVHRVGFIRNKFK